MNRTLVALLFTLGIGLSSWGSYSLALRTEKEKRNIQEAYKYMTLADSMEFNPELAYENMVTKIKQKVLPLHALAKNNVKAQEALVQVINYLKNSGRISDPLYDSKYFKANRLNPSLSEHERSQFKRAFELDNERYANILSVGYLQGVELEKITGVCWNWRFSVSV